MIPADADRAPDTPELLWQIFGRFAGHTEVAYRTREGTLTFAALHDAAAALVMHLRALPDAAARRPVIIWGHKDLRYPIAYWACLLAGVPLVPVEPETPPERLRQIAAHAGAAAIVTAIDEAGTAATSAVAATGLTVIAVDLEASPIEPLRPDTGVSADDVAYIMFSSGTLGQPKGIQVSYANLIDFIGWLDILLPGERGFAVSGNIRYCFDVSLFELWTSWTRLLPITALDHADFAASTGYIRRLAADGVGLWVATPSITRILLSNQRFCAATLPALRLFVFCGEVLTKALVRELWARFPGCRVINTYGPTECTVAVTSVEITQAHLEREGDLPIGYVRPGTTLHAVPSASGNEIEIRGASVGHGYLKLPDKQARAFPEPACYRTGDRGRVDEDGLWFFAGRLDREVKIQGMRIDLDEVEAHIRRQPEVVDVAVDTFLLKGEPRAINAYVIGVTDVACLARLADTLAQELPHYLVPRFWYGGFAAELNNNSKLDRSRLAEAAGSAACRHVHAPRSARPAAPASGGADGALRTDQSAGLPQNT